MAAILSRGSWVEIGNQQGHFYVQRQYKMQIHICVFDEI